MKIKTIKKLSAICGGIAALAVVATIALGVAKPKERYYAIPMIPAGYATGLCGGLIGLAERRSIELQPNRQNY